jgi:hypothetical protein
MEGIAMESVLTKKQVKTFKKAYVEDGREYVLIAKVRYDDEWGNGHNTFTITGEIWRAKKGQPIGRDCESCGCIHEAIAKHLPELVPYIKWHLVSSDGPMHYIANTVYHAQSYSPQYAWIYYTGPQDPLGIEDVKERSLGYEKADKARAAEGQPGYRVVWDTKSAKEANLGHARSSAVWPDATDEDLLAPGLEERLRARLPRLMEEFKAAIESLGFVY